MKFLVKCVTPWHSTRYVADVGSDYAYATIQKGAKRFDTYEEADAVAKGVGRPCTFGVKRIDENKKYRKRLLCLAEFLDALPPEKFDFAKWVGERWDGRRSLCGTTACALGWATTMPEFRMLGLRVRKFRIGGFFHGVVCLKDNDNPIGFRGDFDEAAEKVFGLDYEETHELFVPYPHLENPVRGRLPANASAKEVAEHIRAFVRRKEAEAARG